MKKILGYLMVLSFVIFIAFLVIMAVGFKQGVMVIIVSLLASWFLIKGLDLISQ